MATVTFGLGNTYDWSSTNWSTLTNVQDTYASTYNGSNGWKILSWVAADKSITTDAVPPSGFTSYPTAHGINTDAGDWVNSQSHADGNYAEMYAAGWQAATQYTYTAIWRSQIVVYPDEASGVNEQGCDLICDDGQRANHASIQKKQSTGNITWICEEAGTHAHHDTTFTADTTGWHIFEIERTAGTNVTLRIDGFDSATSTISTSGSGTQFGWIAQKQAGDSNFPEFNIRECKVWYTTAKYVSDDGVMESDSSKAWADAGSGNRWQKLNFTASALNGAGILVEAKCGATAGAGTYETITSGVDFTTKGRYIQIRITLTDGSQRYTPMLQTLTLTSEVGLGATLLDSYPVSNKSVDYVTGDGYSSYVGQSFTTPASGSYVLDSVRFYLKKVGTPTGNVTATLYSHKGTWGTSGLPDTLLATSDTIDSSTISTTYDTVNFNFSGASRVSLTANTHYVILLHAASINNLYIGADNTSATHSGNRAGYYGSSWEYDNNDAIFYVYGSETVESSSPSASISSSISSSPSPSASLSGSPSGSVSSSISHSVSASISSSVSASLSHSLSSSTSSSPSSSLSNSPSASLSHSPSTSLSNSPSTSLSSSPSVSISGSPSLSSSASISSSPSTSVSSSISSSLSHSPSTSLSASVSSSISSSVSSSVSSSRSSSPSTSISSSPSVSVSNSLSHSASTSISASPSTSASTSSSISASSSASPSASTSNSPSVSLSGSLSHSPSTSVSGSPSTSASTSSSISGSPSVSASSSLSPSASTSISSSLSPSASVSLSHSASGSLSTSISPSVSASVSSSRSSSISTSVSSSISSSPSVSVSSSPSASLSHSLSSSISVSPSVSSSASASSSVSASSSASPSHSISSSPSVSISSSISSSPSTSISASISSSPSVSTSASVSSSSSVSLSQSPSASVSPSGVISESPSVSISGSPSVGSLHTIITLVNPFPDDTVTETTLVEKAIDSIIRARFLTVYKDRMYYAAGDSTNLFLTDVSLTYDDVEEGGAYTYPTPDPNSPFLP